MGNYSACSLDHKSSKQSRILLLDVIGDHQLRLSAINALQKEIEITQHGVSDGEGESWSSCHPPARSQICQLSPEHFHNHPAVQRQVEMVLICKLYGEHRGHGSQGLVSRNRMCCTFNQTNKGSTSKYLTGHNLIICDFCIKVSSISKDSIRNKCIYDKIHEIDWTEIFCANAGKRRTFDPGSHFYD